MLIAQTVSHNKNSDMKIYKVLIIILMFFTCDLYGQKLGIIIDDSLQVRNYPNKDSMIVYNLHKYDFVQINEESSLYAPDKPPCDLCYYPWIKIKKSNKIGWITGDYIYKPDFGPLDIGVDKKFKNGFKFFDMNCKLGTLMNSIPHLDSGKLYDGALPLACTIMFYTDKLRQIFVIPNFDNSKGYLYMHNGSSIIDIISGNNSVLIKYNDFEGGESMIRQIILYKNSNSEIVYKEIK